VVDIEDFSCTMKIVETEVLYLLFPFHAKSSLVFFQTNVWNSFFGNVFLYVGKKQEEKEVCEH